MGFDQGKLRRRLPLGLLAAGLLLAGCFEQDLQGRSDAWCHGLADGTPCDDGNPCTVDDVCGLGVCAGRAGNEGSSCDDGDPCTERDSCVTGVCSGETRDCSELDQPCRPGLCDPQTGECLAGRLVDGASCDDGDPCTESDVCSGGSCSGQAVQCPEPPVCQVAVCDSTTGACATEPVADGAPCDDGDQCTSGDSCVAGACRGTAKQCPAVGVCRVASCDPATGLCSEELAADGTGCDDEDPCTDGETCEAGLCTGGFDLCFCQQAGEGTPCDDRNACTEADACRAGECVGVARQCPEAGECQLVRCDPGSGQCVSEPAENGAACDDGDPCTEGETCSEGACGGGENVCFCHDQPDGTPCDDGSPCTTGDSCRQGVCGGAPLDCAALDDDCNVGECEPTSGQCVAQPRPIGTPCDDGSVCTDNDRCRFGQCAGTPLDCSALDGQCSRGVCEEGSGACVATPLADGLPCDDGAPCTGHDDCTGGVCGGETELCGACQGLSAGSPCDDGNPCTSEGRCVEAGELLRCAGEPTDCSALDESCLVGVCDPGSGQCSTVPRADTTPCDDSQACTVFDVCIDGVCGGESVPMCGEEPALCEPAAPNDELLSAVPLALGGDALVLMAWLDPAGETDWFAVQLEQGQLLSVATRPHCASELDTLLGVYHEDGRTLLVDNDDVDEDSWAAVRQVEVPADGTYYIGVTAFASSGTGTYLLEVESVQPPPCTADQDCRCPELTCALEGPSAGRCVPRMPVEEEPNDVPAQAGALAAGEVMGQLERVGDEDWFVVELTQGAPVNLATRTFCGAPGQVPVDTELAVFGPDGLRELAHAADGGGEGHALLRELVVEASGPYLVRVRAEAVTSGAYVLSVEDARCRADADCGCVDQVCSGDAESPGRCVAAHPAQLEPGGAPGPLAVGLRTQASLQEPFAVHSYELALVPGVYDLVTSSYCGSRLDTRLRLLDAAGEQRVADEDGGEGLFAAAHGFSVSSAETYRLQVSAHGAEVGDYVVLVREAAVEGSAGR